VIFISLPTWQHQKDYSWHNRFGAFIFLTGNKYVDKFEHNNRLNDGI